MKPTTVSPLCTLIIDDEPACIKRLAQDLSHYGFIHLAGTATSAERAQELIIHHQPDLLFLDIEMPQTNGIELLQAVRPLVHSGMRVIFYSAFDRYLLDALRASAFDFLLKPYTNEELDGMMHRLLEERAVHTPRPSLEQSLRRLLAEGEKFAVQTITGLLLLKEEEVLCFRFSSDTHCWQLMQTDGKEHRLRTSTTARELLALNPNFMQISQECILNTRYLLHVENRTLHCILCPPHQGMELYASRRYFARMKELLEII